MRVWFAPKDLKGGKKLHEQLFEAIQIHDRLLIVLSEHDIQSERVMTEIRKAREVEKRGEYANCGPRPRRVSSRNFGAELRAIKNEHT